MSVAAKVSQVSPAVSASGCGSITLEQLDSINTEQARESNKTNLANLGGTAGLARALDVNLETGLSDHQVEVLRARFGSNVFPQAPIQSYFSLLCGALSDTVLLILIAAAAVSLAIGIYEEGAESGWIEGGAIFIAVFLVSNIAASNDYFKQLQFLELEKAAAKDERCSVLRNSSVQQINPQDLVVGDVVIFQSGDQILADCAILGQQRASSSDIQNQEAKIIADESSLTGEAEEVTKSVDGDPFLLSSCLITEGQNTHAMVISVGTHSQWGKIKANLVTEVSNTPLQDKLEEMTKQIGYVGLVASFATFVALIISIWTRNGGQNVSHGVINAFILAVTIVVVAIPEGLPLAVTISLAYSTKKMYKDQCFIRVLAACETMGNATNICSDKTGTLTENRMTVVEGWFGDVKFEREAFATAAKTLEPSVRLSVIEQVCVNRSAYLAYTASENKSDNDSNGNKNTGTNNASKQKVVGSQTEGAMMLMCQSWGFDCDEVKRNTFKESTDRVFPFNSNKKRSTAVVHQSVDKVRIYCKGATEWILQNCSHYTDTQGHPQPMTADKQEELNAVVLGMAEKALRTLALVHRDVPASMLPEGWRGATDLIDLDQSDLCVDAIVGIIDPLRGDVKEAVETAKRAGLIVRMVTGDNIFTARAIARECGILTAGGCSLEGPAFRKLTPAQLDDVLPTLQVLARSSPNDKFLLVTRLNGQNLPETQEDWLKKHPDSSWELDRDKILPGYKEEWSKHRSVVGGDVVGVTGDGTNDAPALKAADVGLAMGITGTKVAQAASDIVILDDKFGSIVRAILWGRAVYDNIRKFLQFQLTVNVVALTLVFIGAAAGFGQPLNAIQMLWVNLVMDTLGALALGTEEPTKALLNRKPYKRTASLISRPMMRNILCQSAYQLALLFTLMFAGPTLFGIKPQTQGSYPCASYNVRTGSTVTWNAVTKAKTTVAISTKITCASFASLCNGRNSDPRDLQNNQYCFEDRVHQTSDQMSFTFASLQGFGDECLVCSREDYTHGSIIFNAFIWCQIFNEYSSRNLFDDVNFFQGLTTNLTFIAVSVISIAMQIILIQFGTDFLKTSPLNLVQWLVTIGLGSVTVIIGILMRFIPADEDPDSFFDRSKHVYSGVADRMPIKGPALRLTGVSDGTVEMGRMPSTKE